MSARRTVLPDTTEKLAWGQPTFRVAGKIFASLGDDGTAMGVKCPGRTAPS